MLVASIEISKNGFRMVELKAGESSLRFLDHLDPADKRRPSPVQNTMSESQSKKQLIILQSNIQWGQKFGHPSLATTLLVTSPDIH